MFCLSFFIGKGDEKSNMEIILPTRYCKECQMTEISTVRRSFQEPRGDQITSQNSIKSVIYGRSVGRVKHKGCKEQMLEDNHKKEIVRNESRIKLVRLMFFLPNVKKEKDFGFYLHEVCENYGIHISHWSWFNHRLDNVQTILTYQFQTNHNMFQLQTSNGDMFEDMVLTPKEFDPGYGLSTQEEYYFNSLAHHEKVSEIVNSIGLS